jgi:hypothetical protein
MTMTHERKEACGGDGASVLRLGEHGKGDGVNGGRGQTGGCRGGLEAHPRLTSRGADSVRMTGGTPTCHPVGHSPKTRISNHETLKHDAETCATLELQDSSILQAL